MPEVYKEAAEIDARVQELARELGPGPHLLVGVLKGCAMFLADLARAVEGPADLAFVRARSYGDRTESSGEVLVDAAGPESFEGRDLVVVDTVLDTGHTLTAVTAYLREQGAASIRTCVLLDKPARRQVDVQADLVGWTVPDLFLVGYGLDYSGQHRGLKDLAVI